MPTVGRVKAGTSQTVGRSDSRKIGSGSTQPEAKSARQSSRPTSQVGLGSTQPGVDSIITFEK